MQKFLAGAVGNMVEFYDLAIYAFIAPIIAHQFFSFATADVRLVYTFGIYAISFLIRPIGAVFLSRLADVNGRRPVMLYSISAMVLTSAAMTVLPTYETIFYLAPLLLILSNCSAKLIKKLLDTIFRYFSRFQLHIKSSVYVGL